ncbi:Histone-lysine N-methyltransferase setd3, partial [Durusdinium trenchii]
MASDATDEMRRFAEVEGRLAEAVTSILVGEAAVLARAQEAAEARWHRCQRRRGKVLDAAAWQKRQARTRQSAAWPRVEVRRLEPEQAKRSEE